MTGQISEATNNQATVQTIVEFDRRCNVSSDDLVFNLIDVPQYALSLFNQTIASNTPGDVSLGEEVMLLVTIDFPAFTEDAALSFPLVDGNNSKRIRPIDVLTLVKGINLNVTSVAGVLTANRSEFVKELASHEFALFLNLRYL